MKKLLLFIISFSISALCLAQDSPKLSEGKEATFKPRIGAGVGVFTYLGDVRDNNFNGILTSSYAFEINAARNLSRSFDIELKVLYGNLKVNERKTDRNLNFASDLWDGSANIVYNFNNLYKRDRVVQPFLAIGIGYLSFDSKTDLYDGAGRQYYYWSDGSIRDVAEDSPLAPSAEIIQRDYVYETDLRKLNLDGQGRYKQYAISIPATIGLNFKMGERFNMRLSSSFYYNFTDYIDNVSNAGVAARNGDNKNDVFLYHSFSLSFNLWHQRTAKVQYYKDVDFDGLMSEDSDGDGIDDFDDQCPETPKGVTVTAQGCPIDLDHDGVPYYLDKDPKTPLGAVVDANGIAIDFDKLSEEAAQDTNQASVHLTPVGGKYTVHVGTFTNKIPEDLKQVLRSIKGLQEQKINDTLTVFTVGSYDNFDEAEQTEQKLLKEGVDGAFSTPEAVVYDIAKDLHTLENSSMKTDYLYFKVEFEEYRMKVPFENIRGIIAIYGLQMRTSTGGLKTYTMGKFSSYSNAAKLKEQLEKSGVDEPQVVAYLNGNPISIEEALDLFQKK